MYGDIIMEQERRHFIEKVEETKLPTDRPVHYIPHHPVAKESSTTPIRIVYDCSCKDGRDNPSLNECLESHPPVMNDITGILMRFRAKKYATTSDLEKAFLQIQLDEKDRDATSLCGDNVWRYCPTKDNPADLLTRGITSEELQQNEIWFSGPKWLNSKEDWPTWNGNNVTSSVCTTMSENDDKIETMENNQNVCIGIGEIIDIERYNSYRKLTRITAYVMRFATNCRATETERKKDLLRIDEIENAKFLWIRYKQGKIFSDEINCIDNSTKRKTLVRQFKALSRRKAIITLWWPPNRQCDSRRNSQVSISVTGKGPLH
ncbi:Hypothetical predicted protein [Mytilus galloprovincialis]|uniref:Reverse transcriptase domain-containing protein n=1 Tax=Mytilus galloprovincialis TaxID=29158 RepID=A0A8B6BMK7_MYTGA|nr:Hypothetical predicted protein [Mytilus galloprovincialis]